MGTDTYLRAHNGPKFDFANDTDKILAWRKNDVPLAWLMFFASEDRVLPAEEQPDLTAGLKTAVQRYRLRVTAYADALHAFAETDWITIADYVEDHDLHWLTLGTWEPWIYNLDTYTDEFTRALTAVCDGPASPDWNWMLTWCHPPYGQRTAPHALFGHGGGRPRPWLPKII